MVSLMPLLADEERMKVESRRVCGKKEDRLLVELWKDEVMLSYVDVVPLLSMTVALKSEGAVCWMEIVVGCDSVPAEVSVNCMVRVWNPWPKPSVVLKGTAEAL